MIYQLAQWLVASGNLSDLVIGNTLHVGPFPQNAPNCATALRERTPAYVNKSFKNLREVHIQIVTRGPAYKTAKDEADRIFDFCVNRFGYRLSGWTIMAISGNAPAELGQDEKSRFLFVSNITLQSRKET